MGERKGTKGLELWCRRMTEGYPGVNITNMTTSWRDGLAFCAIIHHFRPDLIEFSKLNKDDIYYNNELAFRIAERHLGIPALLEPEDMVEFPVPDRLSILTYLSQFYQVFVVSQGKSPSRLAPKRPSDSPDHNIVTSPSTSPPSKVPTAAKIRREPCAKCNLPVFIAERLNVGKLLYHRTCFRCARCDSQLTLANYYETENHQFCCEICPDEEKITKKLVDDNNILLNRSLSDEEKSASLKKLELTTDNTENDSYSANFESALEFPDDDTLKRNATLTKSAKDFLKNQLMSSADDNNNSDTEDDEKPPDLPNSSPPKTIINKSIENDEIICDSDSFPTINNKLETNNVNIVSASISDNNVSNVVTKEIDTAAVQSETNIVKARMRLFEQNQIDTLKSDNKNDTKVPSNESIEIIEIHDDEEALQPPPPQQQHQEKEKKKEEEPQQEKDDKKEEQQQEDSKISIDSSFSDNILNKEDDSVIVIEDSSPDNTAIEVDLNVSVEEKQQQQPQTQTEIKEVESAKKDVIEYPDDLNPFGDDDEDDDKTLTLKNVEPYNPFEEEDDDDDQKKNLEAEVPKPVTRRKFKSTDSNQTLKRLSGNPFEDDETQETSTTPVKPQPVVRKKIEAPKISLNPFWSDDEENQDKPVAKPRVSKTSPGHDIRAHHHDSTSVTSTSLGDSSSLSSIQSYGTERRKKKLPAPRPPTSTATESTTSSLTSSPSHSVTHSPKSTPKIRKNRKAPLPPTPIKSPLNPPPNEDIEKEKLAKDEQNRNRQSQTISLTAQSPTSSENSQSLSATPDKSTYGKWKRKKGQAPPRPIPQRRVVKALPLVEVKRELELIEIQQQGLEKQGVKLEQIIRDKCEGEGSSGDVDEPLSPEIDELILQLFELVNEKNELFRKQAELMYLRRQHRLEEEHAEVEYQIRLLMAQPEANKTDSDKAKEEELLQRLVAIVEKRDEIIQCLEMDRVREAEEDDCISSQLNLYTQRKDDKIPPLNESKEKKKSKKKFKLKIQKQKVDADKDIDESEVQEASPKKDKKKKKFNIF